MPRSAAIKALLSPDVLDDNNIGPMGRPLEHAGDSNR
jgi:hypothetical protein